MFPKTKLFLSKDLLKSIKFGELFKE